MCKFTMNATVIDIAVAKKSPTLTQRCVSAKEEVAKPLEIVDMEECPRCTVDYIADLTRELAAIAKEAGLANLTRLLATVQLEAEVWLRQNQ